MDTHQKTFVSVRYFLIGAKMHLALEALEFAAHFHDGTRKDGVTPEFFHQLQIFQYMRTLQGDLSDPEATFASVFLHDTPEDTDVGHLEIERRFGSVVGGSVKFLTKKYRGQTLPTNVYYDGIASHEIASGVKGADRIHNLGSMTGVFTPEKQRAYIEETRTYVLPMLKTARRNFSRQEPVYENEKFVLKSQISLIEAMLGANSTT